MTREVVIVDAVRTAIGSFGGKLSDTPAHVLGAHVIKALLERSGLKPEQVDEIILGQDLTAGSGQNPARQASIAAGLHHGCPAMTINKLYGSGLKAVHLAAQAIKCGDADVIIAGGQENGDRGCGHGEQSDHDRSNDWAWYERCSQHEG